VCCIGSLNIESWYVRLRLSCAQHVVSVTVVKLYATTYAPGDGSCETKTRGRTWNRSGWTRNRIENSLKNIVTWRLKAGIVKSERTAIARWQFAKHFPSITPSTNTRPLLGSRFAYHGNYKCIRYNALDENRTGTRRGSVLYSVLPKVWKEVRPDQNTPHQKGCYIRTITASVQLENKNFLPRVSRGLETRRTDWR
jgi:hypothetical protein